jgi:FixJ family two-component response regulator
VNEPQPTVFLVDDDPSVLRAVSRLLAAEGFHVSSFSSSQQFLDQHDPNAHACVVLDVAMPGLSGLDLQQALAHRGSGLPIIFLTACGNIPMGVDAIKEGAADFLTKPVDQDTLIAAIRTALSKNQVTRHAHAEVADIRRRLATLTPREYEVFQHVVSGRLNKQTAAELGTVEKTIKVHRGRVMEKMQVQSVAELARLAERAGIGVAADHLP